MVKSYPERHCHFNSFKKLSSRQDVDEFKCLCLVFCEKKITCIKTPFFLLQISKYFKILRKTIFLSKHYDLYVFPEFDLKNEKTYDFCRKEMHFTIFVIIYFFILIFNIFNPSLTIDIHTSKDDFLSKHMWIQTYSCRAKKITLLHVQDVLSI